MAMRLSKSIVGEAEAEAVKKVICEDGYLGMGKTTQKFEEEVAAYLGVEPWQVISVNSGTAALHLAVDAVVGQLPPDRLSTGAKPLVLAPSLTFVSSFQAIVAAGAWPVACDVLPDTGTLDLEDAAKRLTEDVVAVMHVDYASNPWHLDAVYEFGAKNGLRVIDDAAHAFGCRHHGRKVGSFGDLVCFSFDGIKNITCGEGGCLVAFDRESARLAADARLLGVENDSAKRFAGARSWDPDVTRSGLRYHLSNIMAAIGRTQLARLESEFIPARRRLYDIYKKCLADVGSIRLFKTDPQDFIVPHIMPVRVMGGHAHKLREFLEEAGVSTGMHYKPNHLLTLFGKGEISLPHVEELYGELVTLPLHPGLTDGDVRYVCETIHKFFAIL